MANQLKIKRGTKASLPTLAAGELGFCTDTYETYVGTGSVNKIVGGPNPTFESLTVDTNTIYVDKVNHRVGIGRTDPSYNLDVAGTIRSTGSAYINGNATISGSLTAANIKRAINTVSVNLGSPTVEEMALFHGQYNNKFRFISPILQEESTNGTDWTTSNRLTSNQLADLMLGEGQTTSVNVIPAPTIGGQGHYRLTWDCALTGYICLNALYVYHCNNGNVITYTIEQYHNTNGWSTIVKGTATGWPAHVFIPHTAVWFSTNASQYGKVRITWSILSATYANPYTLYAIEWFGGYPAARRNVEYYDRNKNVIFPANVRGTTLTSTIATGTAPLSVTSTTAVTNLNADLLDGNHATAFALVGQTMYIGTTGVAINRTSGSLSLTGVNIDGSSGSCTGNAATATTLQTARTINGVSFNGSANITITADPNSHTHGNIANGGTIGSASGLPIITGTSGILQAGSFGNSAGTFCQGNDSRLHNQNSDTGTSNSTFQIGTGGAMLKSPMSNFIAVRNDDDSDYGYLVAQEALIVAGSYMHTITGNSLSANVSHYLPAVSGTLINSGLLTTQGDIIYASAANTAARLGKGTAGQVLTMNSGATAPEWKTPSSGGKVAQIVETATTSEYYTNATIPLDNTIPQNTEGAELMTVSITPTNANSKLVVEVDLPITDIHYYYFIMALFKDSTANALNATFRGEAGQAGIPRPMRMTYSMTAGGTSQITFKLRYGGTNASYNVYVNRTYNSSIFGGIARATLRVTEYLP